MAKRRKEYPINKIKPKDSSGMDLRGFISEIFKDYGDDFAKMFFEKRLSNETETSIIFYLQNGDSWKNKELVVTLRDRE